MSRTIYTPLNIAFPQLNNSQRYLCDKLKNWLYQLTNKPPIYAQSGYLRYLTNKPPIYPVIGFL